MAAAEYYNPSGARPPTQAPTAAAPMVNNNLAPPGGAQNNPPYPMFDGPPPPYSAQGPARPHSQPAPQQRVRFDTNTDTHQYPPEKLPQQPQAPPQQPQRPISNLQNMYRSSDYTATQRPASQLQPYPPPNNADGYWPPNPNVMGQVYGSQPGPQRRYSSTPGAYQRYESPPGTRSRSRSRERRWHRHSHDNRNSRPDATRKKSSGVNTFLGAGGGAIVGDLIFPGLGTIGGAILGGLGGHEYTKQRADYGKDSSRGGVSRSYIGGDRDCYYEEVSKRGRR